MARCVTEVFRYMFGYRIECIRILEDYLVCCTSHRVLVWDTSTKELKCRTKKSFKISGVTLCGKNLFLSTQKALYNESLHKMMDMEFSASIFITDSKLVAIGERFVTIFNGKSRDSREHKLNSGICTSARLKKGSNIAYVSFENGKIFEVRDVLGSFRTREVTYLKEAIVSIDLISEDLLISTFDCKLLILDPKDGSFIFTRVNNETKKVMSFAGYALLLDCEGCLMVFNKSLVLVDCLGTCVIDFDISQNTIFIATSDRQIIQYEALKPVC